MLFEFYPFTLFIFFLKCLVCTRTQQSVPKVSILMHVLGNSRMIYICVTDWERKSNPQPPQQADNSVI